MSFERSARRRIRRAGEVRWDELRRRQASVVMTGREQGKASLVVARVVCAARERVLGWVELRCVVGDVNAGMLATWCVQVDRNQSLDCMARPDEQWTRWTAGSRRRGV